MASSASSCSNKSCDRGVFPNRHERYSMVSMFNLQVKPSKRRVQMLIPGKEKSLLHYIIDECEKLGFSACLYMVHEKATLLHIQNPNAHPQGENWICRFLKRHPEYCTRFLRHLDSERPPPYGHR